MFVPCLQLVINFENSASQITFGSNIFSIKTSFELSHVTKKLPFYALDELTYNSTRQSKAALYKMQSNSKLIFTRLSTANINKNNDSTSIPVYSCTKTPYADLLKLQDNSENTPVTGRRMQCSIT